MPVDISFIIPHKGRIELLTQTIDSIIKQKFDLSRIEIIVVTQNTDLSQINFNAGALGNLTILNRPTTDTISSLRNFGVKQSSGEFLAFLDADIALATNWISAMLMELENPKFILVSAAQANDVDAPPLEKIRTALSNATLDTEVNFLPGRNLFLRKADFDRTEGFPEHLITCEDYYFTDQLHHLGILYYSSKASYVHLGEDKKYPEMFKKEVWRGQSNLLSIKGRKIPIREIPSIVVPLSIVLLLFIGIIFFILNFHALTLVLLGAILFLFFSYTFRLMKLLKGDVTSWHVIKFYLYYFPARAYGTIVGLFKSLDVEK
jgi:glycosyltransferase involved in cell wall biosynthesis